MKPGLEVKYACEEAEEQGAKTYFLGPEFNQTTWHRLFHETRMNVPHYLYKRVQYEGHSAWSYERQENAIRM